MKQTAFHINDVPVVATTHKTLHDMAEYIRSMYGVEHPEGKGGAFTIWRTDKVHVHFAEEMLLLDSIAHEAFHVAMCIGRAMGMEEIDEEPLAEVCGEFVRMYINHIFELDDDYCVLVTKQLLSAERKQP